MNHDTDNGLQPLPTLVVGLGETGLSCARHLARQGVPLAVTDSRARPPGLEALRAELPAVQAHVGGFDAEQFAWAQRLVVSPGVALSEPLIAAAQERGVEVLGDIELFAREARAPIVAITGSNGKSTVTALLGEMASNAGREVRVGGNIGTPALALLGDSEPDLYLLELSSFQLETTHNLNAAAAAVLNISPDHLDRYASLADYVASKQRILAPGLLRPGGVAVVNRDDPRVVAMLADRSGKTLSFGLGAPGEGQFGRITRNGETWLARGTEALLPVTALAMAGEQAQANALAALALGEAIGEAIGEVTELPIAAMLATLQSFPGLAHRTQFVAETNGVRWINDSKGTNVGATLAAVQGLPGPLLLIAGGQAKGADFSPLADALRDKVQALILLGEDAARLEEALGDAAPVHHAADMSDAVHQAQQLAAPGDTVLLSPACASFDMFSGFAARGEAFMAAVHALASDAGGGR